MKALFSLRRVVTLRPQQLIVTPTFTRNSIIRKPDLAWNKSDRRFFETGQISTYKRLRSFLQARNYYGGYKFYTAALESDTKFTADDFLLMLKILAKVDSHKIVEETRRIISAMDAQQVTPTKEHLKAIIEVLSLSHYRINPISVLPTLHSILSTKFTKSSPQNIELNLNPLFLPLMSKLASCKTI